MNLSLPEVHYEEVGLKKRPASIEMYENSSYLATKSLKEREQEYYSRENRNVRIREEKKPTCSCCLIVDISWRVSMTILVLAVLCFSVWLLTTFIEKDSNSSLQCSKFITTRKLY